MTIRYKIYFLVLLFSLFAIPGLNAEDYIAIRDIKFRDGKGGHGHIIGSIKKNTIVDVSGIDGVWCKITYNGRDGYVKGKYLRQAPKPPIVQKPPVAVKKPWLPFSLDTDSVVGFLMSVLIIAVIIRQTSMFIARRKARAAFRPEYKKTSATHWYQCKHCRVAIRKDSEPGIAGCSQSSRHLWTNLGEIGDIKYICKGCSTIITVKSEPLAEGCPNGGDHFWKKI